MRWELTPKGLFFSENFRYFWQSFGIVPLYPKQSLYEIGGVFFDVTQGTEILALSRLIKPWWRPSHLGSIDHSLYITVPTFGHCYKKKPCRFCPLLCHDEVGRFRCCCCSSAEKKTAGNCVFCVSLSGRKSIKGKRVKRGKGEGGFFSFNHFYPDPWGNDSSWWAYVSNGLVQPPPPRFSIKSSLIQTRSRSRIDIISIPSPED